MSNRPEAALSLIRAMAAEHPAEFDRIAREQGYVKVDDPKVIAEWSITDEVDEADLLAQGYLKRPICGECKGTGECPNPIHEREKRLSPMHSPGMANPHLAFACVGHCPSCGGTGFGRLVAIPPDAVTIPGHYWIDGERVEDPSAALVLIPLAALDGGQE